MRTKITTHYKCDWCPKEATAEGSSIPKGWVRSILFDVVKTRSPGEHFCSKECMDTSQKVWERAIEYARGCQINYYKAVRNEVL